jgi:hypothetical protein
LKENEMNKAQTAELLGAKAFAAGAPLIPALDKELMNLIEGTAVGEAAPVLRAWQRGWINAPMPA